MTVGNIRNRESLGQRAREGVWHGMTHSWTGGGQVAEKRSERADILRVLLEYIRFQGLNAGDRLPSIRQLAKEWQVSPSVVRDAVLYASSLGWVEVQPRLGVFVRSPKPSPATKPTADVLEVALAQEEQNLFHVIEARRLIEEELIGIACQRRQPADLLPMHQALAEMATAGNDRARFLAADEKFHLALAAIAANEVLITFLRTLLSWLRPLRTTMVLSDSDRAKVVREHEALYHAVREGRTEEAKALMVEHISAARRVLLKHLEAIPPCASFAGGSTSMHCA